MLDFEKIAQDAYYDEMDKIAALSAKGMATGVGKALAILPKTLKKTKEAVKDIPYNIRDAKRSFHIGTGTTKYDVNYPWFDGSDMKRSIPFKFGHALDTVRTKTKGLLKNVKDRYNS